MMAIQPALPDFHISSLLPQFSVPRCCANGTTCQLPVMCPQIVCYLLENEFTETSTTSFAFSALTLLAGHQEEHLACKK